MDEQPRELTALVSFVCPFCGRKASAVEPAGVVHEMPECSQFRRLDVVDYLAAVNRELTRRN